jgi:hypothetical protein
LANLCIKYATTGKRIRTSAKLFIFLGIYNYGTIIALIGYLKERKSRRWVYAGFLDKSKEYNFGNFNYNFGGTWQPSGSFSHLGATAFDRAY